jgi:DNA repair photolyase
MFVRWSNLTVEAEQQHRLPGYRDPASVRQFDAPEALDTRFYEVRAKSALNKVPAASQMPFRWTVNPYRGCSHACSYCLGGETLVLMADGRARTISELQVGDSIVGTRQEGAHRRFVETQVLDKWSSIKPAWQVRLDDGTRLLASAEHRFLSDRGWKHVTGAERGPSTRPHLTLEDKLLGPGADVAAPERDDPAISRRRTIIGGALKAEERLRVESIRPLGMVMRMYDITTGTEDFIANGVVSHNCFARPTHTYLGFNAGRDFEREIVVKVNAPEVLRAELARPSWKGEHVALGTNTDPYQWVEGRYRLMEGIWEALLDARNPCSILTKSPLLLRDIELMRRLRERVGEFTACLSIPTLDEKAWRETEPRTPNPKARLEAVAELNRAGIPTGVLIAPLMPGINDAPHQVEPLLAAAAEAGATSVGGIALHLRGEVRDVFMDWMRAKRPDLVPRYEELYKRGAYAPKLERERLGRLVRKGGRPGRFRRVRPGSAEEPARAGSPREAAGQQSLF